ncbi:hypothetical protein LZ30DRAFT_294720 [Colletotrichum cereale]|nr:hypothetical protein LZ30DRAFT_294720 [Colletotrichum cereale]
MSVYSSHSLSSLRSPSCFRYGDSRESEGNFEKAGRQSRQKTEEIREYKAVGREECVHPSCLLAQVPPSRSARPWNITLTPSRPSPSALSRSPHQIYQQACHYTIVLCTAYGVPLTTDTLPGPPLPRPFGQCGRYPGTSDAHVRRSLPACPPARPSHRNKETPTVPAEQRAGNLVVVSTSSPPFFVYPYVIRT